MRTVEIHVYRKHVEEELNVSLKTITPIASAPKEPKETHLYLV